MIASVAGTTIPSVLVSTVTAIAESGDVSQLLRNGAFVAEPLAGTLADRCAGRHPGRRDPQELTLFKAVGTGCRILRRRWWPALNSV